MQYTVQYTVHKKHDSKVHVANMGPSWGRQDPCGPHVGPINFLIWEGHARESCPAVPHCDLKLPQCHMIHSGEYGGLIISLVIITTAKQITINIAYVSYIQSSKSTPIDTPAQLPLNSQHAHWRKICQQGYQMSKKAPQGSQYRWW